MTNSAHRISRTEQRLRYGSIKAFIKEKAAADNERQAEVDVDRWLADSSAQDVEAELAHLS